MGDSQSPIAENHRTTSEPDRTAELTATFSEMVTALFAGGSAAGTLQTVVDLAVATIEGCDYAGIFLVLSDVVKTPALTDPIVGEVDALQQRHRQGPCLGVISDGGTIYAEDLESDPRWPLFGAEATAAGIRSALAIRLSANGSRGALNLYARYPHAFGVIDRGKASILAGLAGLALSVAESHDAELHQVDNLQAALFSREVIGQAEGILMERERISGDQAFDVLRRASQHLNVKLRDVAQALVDTGERPATGGPGTPGTSPKAPPGSA
ncbi:MAG: GAF and ANTAR domain-containing protein [Acidimicrobiales bacterium]